jgi:hypothetical protein
MYDLAHIALEAGAVAVGVWLVIVLAGLAPSLVSALRAHTERMSAPSTLVAEDRERISDLVIRMKATEAQFEALEDSVTARFNRLSALRRQQMAAEAPAASPAEEPDPAQGRLQFPGYPASAPSGSPAPFGATNRAPSNFGSANRMR